MAKKKPAAAKVAPAAMPEKETIAQAILLEQLLGIKEGDSLAFCELVYRDKSPNAPQPTKAKSKAQCEALMRFATLGFSYFNAWQNRKG